MTITGNSIDNNSSGWKKTLCLIMLFFYCSAILEPLNMHMLGTLVTLMQFAVVFIMIPDLLREFKKIKGNSKSLIYVPLGVIVLFALQAVLWGSILLPFIRSSLGITMNDANSDLVTGMVRNHPVVMGTMVCVHGPIIEEILYRYTAFGILFQKNRFAAYLISMFLFGLQHVIVAAVWGDDPIQFINMPGYIIAGFIFAFLYSKTRTLAIPILVHMISNSIGLLFMYVSVH
ncbi:MAG: CPBP family intramembrane metalloprotease [Saccharofermentans sp.]|nr:CPBP family intramembrane metalloprotease [Saccharofermentans sp.]